jgi:hypothetical protein
MIDCGNTNMARELSISTAARGDVCSASEVGERVPRSGASIAGLGALGGLGGCQTEKGGEEKLAREHYYLFERRCDIEKDGISATREPRGEP